MWNLKNQKLLVIAPHPDDEVLGCGGLIRKIKSQGGKVYVLFLTVGDTFDYARGGKSTSTERLAEIEKVAKYLEFDDYRIAFPGDDFHLKLDSLPQKEIVSEIENGSKVSLNKIKPTIVTTTHASDYNQDHRVCAEAVFAATRPAPNLIKPLQRMILGYESMAAAQWHDPRSFTPNTFIELNEDEIEAKIHALKLYKSQLGSGNHQRNPKVMKKIASVRGLSCGMDFAEAYYSFRTII